MSKCIKLAICKNRNIDGAPMKFILFILLPISLFSQTWTDPVNISNLPGLDTEPDLCIDKNGTLHCVFTHKLGNNWRKIYYTKSSDNGITWVTPEDISLNNSLSMMNPKIVADTNNILYVTYDFNTGNPNQTLVYLKTYDNGQWSEAFIVSDEMFNSAHNVIALDRNNRLYVFWVYVNQLPYYRYFENAVWSEIYCPYPGDHSWGVVDVAVDDNNNLHCIGMYREAGQPPSEDRVIYFTYEFDTYWTDKTFLSERTVWVYGNEIDLDTANLPHVTYRKEDPYSGGPGSDDSTMYIFYDGISWSDPELVVYDPYGQSIAVDVNNRVNILDWEKLDTGYKIVHYQKINGLWQGIIVDETSFYLGFISLIKSDQKLFTAYYWSDQEGEGEIRLSSFDIITEIEDNEKSGYVKHFLIYPNPFTQVANIEFSIERDQHVDVSIYNISGQKITTLTKKDINPGKCQLQWNGKDLNGKEVKPGLYLICLQWSIPDGNYKGKYIVTRIIEKFQ
jgi:hypothetical protein